MIKTERGRGSRSDSGSPPLALLAIPVAIVVATMAGACSRTPVLPPAPRNELTIANAVPRGYPLIGLGVIADQLRTDSLISLAPDGRPEPRLAQSWSRSPDGTTWTFSIAPNIYFQDGRRATAKVLATLLQAAAADPGNRAVGPNLADVVSITAPDDNTIVIRTAVPRALLIDQLSGLTIPLQPSDGALGAFVRDTEGPDSLSFRAFDTYYRGRPGVEKVTYHTYRSLRAAWAAMMRGETDAIHELSGDTAEFFEAETGVRVYRFGRPFPTSIIFNVRRPQLRDAAVRRALSSMIDRAQIVHSVLRGRGTAATGPLWPPHWSLTGRSAPAQARASGSSGLPRRSVAGPPGAMPASLRFTCLVVPEFGAFERTALLVQKQLYDHGVDMELQSVTVPEMQARLASGDFDAVLFEFLARTPNWIYSFWHSPPAGARAFMKTGYRGADAPLDRLLAAGTDEEVRRAIADVYTAMDDDPPAIFLYWPEAARAINRQFDTPLGEGRDVLAAGSLWMVRPAGGRR